MLNLLLARSIHLLSSHAFSPLPPRHSRTGAQTDEKLPQMEEDGFLSVCQECSQMLFSLLFPSFGCVFSGFPNPATRRFCEGTAPGE